MRSGVWRSCRRAAEIGVDDARVADHRLGRALAEQLAGRHDKDAPAQPHDHVHVVLDDEQRDAAPVDLNDALDDHLEEASD